MRRSSRTTKRSPLPPESSEEDEPKRLKTTRRTHKKASERNKKEASPNKSLSEEISIEKSTKSLENKQTDDSSSESDIEDYLQPADQIDLNSTFFQTSKNEEPTKSFNDIENNIFAGIEKLSDSESEEHEEIEVKPTKINFQQLHDYTKKIEDAKKIVQKYEAKKKSKATKSTKSQDLNVSDLLALGETKVASAELLTSVHSSDFESLSDSEKEDWEEVEEQNEETEKSIIPKGGVQVTVELPGVMRKKKGIDLIACMKRRLNRIRKENQVYVHQVHLLCWIAHGNYVNQTLNTQSLLALALSLIPSQHCYPPERTDLNYLEQIVKWYSNTLVNIEKPRPKEMSLEKLLSLQITRKQAFNKKMLVYIFICLLRSLGIQCRLVLAFQVEPLRPPSSDLHSLSVKEETKGNNAKISAAKQKTKEGPVKPTDKNKLMDNKQKKDEKIIPRTTENKTKHIKNTREEHTSDGKKTKESKTNDLKKTNENKGKQNKTNEIKKGNENKAKENEKQQIKSKEIITNENKGKQSNSKENRAKENKGNEGKERIDDIKRSKTKVNKNESNDLKKTDESKTTDCKNTNVNKTKETKTNKVKETKENETIELKKAETKLTSPKMQTRKRSRLSSQKNNNDTQTIPQVDGVNDSDDEPTTSKKKIKPNLKKLSQEEGYHCPKNHPKRLKSLPNYTEEDSDDDFKEQTGEKPSKSKNRLKLENLKPTVKKSPPKRSFSPNKPGDVRNDIISIMKGRMAQERAKERNVLVKHRRPKQRIDDDDDDSDYAPEPVKKKLHDSDDEQPKVKVKQRVQVKRNEDEEQPKTKKGMDVWVEVFLEAEEKWISADVVKGQVHCVKELYSRASHPITYVVAWNNDNSIKDITQRYCSNWNTVTRKLRIDKNWWEDTLRPYIGRKLARDKEEDEDLARLQLDQPLPTTINEYKNHPLYVIKRHLLKFEALYPPEPVILGFVRKEAVYSRECVHTLHSREVWIKHAKVVKLGEKPYKIVKARPKYDKLSGKVITDQLLDLFGTWQIEDYTPPTAENGIVPRNAYGNVELFKPCMLPKGTVHLQLPGLNKVARKMNIDCATAVVGFDFHGGWNHPLYDGFIVCEEFSEVVIAAWYLEQEEQEQKEREKIEKRVYGNWKKLIKGLLIRERLKARYDFGAPSQSGSSAGTKKKSKGPKFLAKKRRICSGSESDCDLTVS